MEQLESLRSRSMLPTDAVDFDLSKTTSISEFYAMEFEQRLALRDEVALVCDGATWVVADNLTEDGSIQPSTTFISGDGVLISRHLRRAKFCMSAEHDFGLVNTDVIPLYTQEQANVSVPPVSFVRPNNIPKGEGEIKMSDTQNPATEQSQDLAQQLANIAEQSAATTSTGTASFAPPSAGVTVESGDEGGSTTNAAAASIRKITANTKISDNLTKYFLYMQQQSRLLGYMTRNDEYITASLKQASSNRDNLLSTAPAPEKEKFSTNRKNEIPLKYFENPTALEFNQIKPGAIVGVVIEAPLELSIDLLELSNPEYHFVAPKEPEKRIFSFRRNDAFAVLPRSFPRGIIESDKTHADPDMITVRATYSRNKDTGSFKESRSLYSPNKKHNFIRETNYFPFNTFVTVNLKKANFDDNEIAGLNNAAFFNLLKDMSDVHSKFAKLKATDKAIFKGTENNENIVSSVFAAAIGNRTPINVRKYSNRKENLADINFPVKEIKVSTSEKTAGTKRAVYLKVNCVNAEVIEKGNPWSSLIADRFAKIREVFGPAVMSVENLRAISRSTGNAAAKTSNAVEGMDLFKMLLEGSYHKTSDVEYDALYNNPQAIQAVVEEELFRV